MQESLNPNTKNGTCLNINYYTLFVISILFYIESITALGLSFPLASEFGSSGLGTFAIWIYHIVAIIILAVISLIIFLIELAIRYIFKNFANIGLNKKLAVIFIGGFILPILTIFIIPILSMAFDVKLGVVGVGKLFPFQSNINNIIQSKNLETSQEELDRINNKPYKSYEELKTERETTQNESPQEKEVIFYSEQITPNGIEKSVILKPNKKGASFP
ncbi:hypothetical protein IJ579_02810 [bacterium]|nr:hypothetical protein [bacterium]